MISENIKKILIEIPSHVKLVAVSKNQTAEAIMEVYNAGHRSFGENKVQEMVSKYEELPKDIEWHLIGHLQSNKVKYIVPFVYMIHSVDSIKLLDTIQKEAAKQNRKIKCLLQMYIASEETKFGMNEAELEQLIDYLKNNALPNIDFAGMMGMASFSDDEKVIKNEFRNLALIYDKLKKSVFVEKHSFNTLSMGMSGDYKLAIEEGSNLVRIGSYIFGKRLYTQK